MTGIFQGDQIIKSCLSRGLDDIRKNPWLLDHIFSSIKDQQELKNIHDFWNSNDFPVLMSNRKDTPPGFFISINLGSSKEDKSQAFLGDMSNETVNYLPSEINKPIPFIIKPFSIQSYDITTGIVTIPDSILEYKYLSAGMLSINPATGEACEILEVLGSNQYTIQIGSIISETQAITPQYPLYRARMECATFLEDYTIGCHCSGDVLFAIYLHSIVLYSLLRYRESLLEAEGFQISTVSSSEFVKNSQYEGNGETMFSRYITLTGQVQQFWIKTPQRFIESVDLSGSTSSTTSTNSINPSGIKIISSDRVSGADDQNDLWSTIDDSDDIIPDNDDDDPFWKI